MKKISLMKSKRFAASVKKMKTDENTDENNKNSFKLYHKSEIIVITLENVEEVLILFGI